MAAAGLAAEQLAQLLALRTAALDHAREALTAVIQQSSGKDIRLRELEQTVVELRAADRQKNDLLSQVETEITEMRGQMQQAKTHYEQLIAQVEQNAQRSVLSAQQSVAELRATLEQTVIDNTGLRERIEKLKAKHATQLEQLSIRQKQEMFIAQSRYEQGSSRALPTARAGRPALGDSRPR